MNWKEMKKELDAVAVRFWTERGAVIGAVQNAGQIRLGDEETYCCGHPARFDKPGAEFLTVCAEVEAIRGRFSGNDELRLTLWVRPILKDGSAGQPIRFSWTVETRG